MVLKKQLSRDSKTIGLFLFFELLIFAIIFVLTFVKDVRNAILGRTVGSRTDAVKKGYGYYSDPEYGECFTQSGDCSTPGDRFAYRRCIPNFMNGNQGTGCIDENTGLFTYNMIIEEQSCNKQCFSDVLTLQDNIETVPVSSSGKNLVSNVGTHQILEKETGIVVSDYFIGDFDPTVMTYKLKNCITSPQNYSGFKEKKYTCQNSTQGGINGCTYTCGSDATLNYNSNSSRNSNNFLGTIPYPFYLDSNGNKIFVCKDIQDNNSVQIMNYNKTVPKDFVIPEKCYNHVNLIEPPDTNGGILQFDNNYNYDVSDRYMFTTQDPSVLSQYFQLDYNLINGVRTYVKIISNEETMILSRYFEAQNGATSLENEDDWVAYVALPTNIFDQQDLDSSSQLNFNGNTNFLGINIIKTVGIVDISVTQNGYFFIPFLLISDFFQNTARTGNVPYLYNGGDFSLKITPNIPASGTFYIFFKLDTWVPRIFQIEFDSNGTATVDMSNFIDYTPSTNQGTLSMYLVDYSSYTVGLNNGGDKHATLDLSALIITGCMYVDDFNLTNTQDQVKKITKEFDGSQGFYIKGTPSVGSTSAGDFGFYYPLYLAQISSLSFKFDEYGSQIFYMPETDQNLATTYVQGDWEGYDFLTGVGSINLRAISTSLNYGAGNAFLATCWTTPYVIMPGEGYQPNTYQIIEDTNSLVLISSVQDGSLLELARNGDDLFDGFEIIKALDGQLRKTTSQSYQVQIYPEKILQIERNFGNFLGPYKEDEDGVRDFVCVDSTGAPLPDGTKVNFNIGETVTALVQDYNFNTDIPYTCGTINIANGSGCREPRNGQMSESSSDCNTFNPNGEYVGISNFLENGYLLETSNELNCFVDGKIVDDNRCTKPFLTDYFEADKTYDIGQELIVNNSDIKNYISLENNNTDLPSQDSWATVSRESVLYFNTGQYLGIDQTYITDISGYNFMNPDYAIEYITLLKYRTQVEFNTTNQIIANLDLDQFRSNFNITTPYLLSSINQDMTFTFVNGDVLNPTIKVSSPVFSGKTGKVWLNENYINILLWYMTAYQFLNYTVSAPGDKYSDLEYINFAQLTESGVNSLDAFNDTDGNGKSNLTLTGPNKTDLTGYYCYFIPFVASDAHSGNRNNFDSLYPQQWIAYIYNLYSQNPTTTPSKFEVVYIDSYDSSENQIAFTRNVTNIPPGELFKFIDLPTQPMGVQADAVLGLFFPISKEGPLQRLNILNNESFNITFSIPENYINLVQHIQTDSGSEIQVYGDSNNDQSFFNYGYNGFLVQQKISTPSYRSIVQYDQNRSDCMAYIKLIRVSGNQIYMSQVGDGDLTYRQGDVISFEDSQFRVIGTKVAITSSGTLYEKFDYQLQLVAGEFITNYNNDKYFNNYIKYNTQDRIIPSIYSSSGTYRFVLNSVFDYSNPSQVTIIPSLTTSPNAPLASITTQVGNISFLQDPSAIANFPGDFIELVNSGSLTLTSIYTIDIDNIATIQVEQVIGKPYGRLSFTGEITNNYQQSIAGRSFISQFTIDNNNLSPNTRYEINGYNFGKEDKPLTIVEMMFKSYTTGFPVYRNNQNRAILADTVIFKDYRSKLTYRNQSSQPIKFDPTNISRQNWADNGKINPQIDYKLYHSDEIFSEGDLVKYQQNLWTAVKDIPLPPAGGSARDPPDLGNSDWQLFIPSGELYSSLNYFDAALTDLDDGDNSIQNLTVTSSGDKHIFPTPIQDLFNYSDNNKNYLFNTRYLLDMTGTPDLYLSSNGILLTDKYNFTENEYIMEITYYLDSVEVSRDDYLARQNPDKVEIMIQMRRGQISLLSPDSTQNIIQYGSDNTTSDGQLLFVNNNQDLTQQIYNLNKIDNQNVPIRLGNYGSLGYCFSSCVKNIQDSYQSSAFGYIDLISANLVSDYFNNRIRILSDSNSFISVSNEPCNFLGDSSDRYLSPCKGRSNGTQIYSQYLFQIPKLSRQTYGVPFCGTTGPDNLDSFLYANSVFLYLVPMDIDSQNFLRFSIKDSSQNIINANKYFHYYADSSELSIPGDQGIIAETDGSFSQLSNTITLDMGQNQTRLVFNDFNKSVLTMGPITINRGNDNITFTPTVFDLNFQFNITDSSISDNIIDYLPWWLEDSKRGVISHGIFFNIGDGVFNETKIVKLSYIQDLESFVPGSLTINFKVEDQTFSAQASLTNNNIYTIEDFTLDPQNTISDTSPGVFTGTTSNIQVYVYFNGSGTLYQAGDYSYSSSTSFEDDQKLYFKYQLVPDSCICKIYVNYGRYNGFLSYPTKSENFIPTDQDQEISPLIFNRVKEGPLSVEKGSINIVSGDDLVQTSDFASTFIIRSGGIFPNPISNPFNLNQNSEYYPDLVSNSNGVISSTTSNILIASDWNDFSFSDYGDAIEYLSGVNGEDQETYLSNQQLQNFSYRQNLVRQNYPDTQYECNIILNPTLLLNTQATYKPTETSDGEYIINGEDSVEIKTNNRVEFDQTLNDAPLTFLISGQEITETTTSYANQQYLTIVYTLDGANVSRQTYQDITSFQTASSKIIILNYETLLDTNTSPVVDSIGTINSLNLTPGFSISIVSS